MGKHRKIRPAGLKHLVDPAPDHETVLNTQRLKATRATGEMQEVSAGIDRYKCGGGWRVMRRGAHD